MRCARASTIVWALTAVREAVAYPAKFVMKVCIYDMESFKCKCEEGKVTFQIDVAATDSTSYKSNNMIT